MVMPEDCDRERGGYQLRLLHKSGAVLAHGLDHTHGGGSAEAGLRLAGDQEGVHEGLGVVLAYPHQQVMDQAPHRLHCSVNACYHLQQQSEIMRPNSGSAPASWVCVANDTAAEGCRGSGSGVDACCHLRTRNGM